MSKENKSLTPDQIQQRGSDIARLAQVSPPPDASDMPAEDVQPGLSKPSEEHKNILLAEQEVKDKEANRALREKYAKKAHDLATWSIIFWAASLIAVGGINIFHHPQILSDKILITITTGATINVLAAFLVVIRGLFSVSDRKQDR